MNYIGHIVWTTPNVSQKILMDGKENQLLLLDNTCILQLSTNIKHELSLCKRGCELTSRFAENATCHNLSIISFEVSVLLIDFPIIVINCHYLWFTFTQRWSKQY